jgi:hypothetical protein
MSEDNTTETEPTITVHEAVKQKIKDIAPNRGEMFVDILETYADKPEVVKADLPKQSLSTKTVDWYDPISIDEVADRHEIEISPGNIDLLARAVIFNHWRNDEKLREAVLDEDAPDRWDMVTQGFFGMVTDTLQELHPYEYREQEEQINEQLEKLPAEL